MLVAAPSEVRWIKEPWAAFGEISQPLAKAIAMAEPNLPLTGSGLDRNPAGIGAMLLYGLGAETARAKLNGHDLT
jgi:hypothetical protein